ncbi:late lactation protein [Sarcophilus harrisii]|uniref:Lipocalin/cytosolic fatty-acid binding domain-containing protein n=1 Tax=Sarcophilus harrisii TaxID=9305 RepID=A0A7N4NWH7_SARHA|nr:late lactation protein [Sarcophilus harrisii]
MKVLFFTIALSLFSILHADDFTFSEFKPQEGTYYVKVISVDNKFPEEEIPKDVSPLTITYLNDRMEARFTMMKMDNKCEEITMMLENSDEPRRVDMNRYQRYTCAIVKTSEKNYWILSCQNKFHPRRMIELMGPDTDENPKAMQEFYNFIHRERVDKSRIIFPRQIEACIPERV